MDIGGFRPDRSNLWGEESEEAPKAAGAVPEDNGGATGPAEEGGKLACLTERLVAIEAHLAKTDERARHRESIIDRLHTENQELRAGERRSILDPVITDLVRLHDQLECEGNGLTDRGEPKLGGLLLSLADDVLLALERIGVEPFPVEVGDTFRSELHRPLSAIETTEVERANTIARVVTHGFRDMESGRVRRRAQAHFYRCACLDSDVPVSEQQQ